MERCLEHLTEEALSDAASREWLQRLVQTGEVFRAQATHFLNSDAVSGIGESLVYDAKRHIHTDLGQVLTLTRAFLREHKTLPLADPTGDKDRTSLTQTSTQQDPEQQKQLFNSWQEVLSSLRTGRWPEKETNVREQIMEAAAAARIEVVFASEMPRGEAAHWAGEGCKEEGRFHERSFP